MQTTQPTAARILVAFLTQSILEDRTPRTSSGSNLETFHQPRGLPRVVEGCSRERRGQEGRKRGDRRLRSSLCLLRDCHAALMVISMAELKSLLRGVTGTNIHTIRMTLGLHCFDIFFFANPGSRRLQTLPRSFERYTNDSIETFESPSILVQPRVVKPLQGMTKWPESRTTTRQRCHVSSRGRAGRELGRDAREGHKRPTVTWLTASGSFAKRTPLAPSLPTPGSEYLLVQRHTPYCIANRHTALACLRYSERLSFHGEVFFGYRQLHHQYRRVR